MFLLFSHLIYEKVASIVAYLKSWWNVVLVFGKEHAHKSNIRDEVEKSIIFRFGCRQISTVS